MSNQQECFKVWLKILSLAFLLLQRNVVMLVSESPVSIQIDVTLLIKGSRKVWGTALLIYALNGNRLRLQGKTHFLVSCQITKHLYSLGCLPQTFR